MLGAMWTNYLSIAILFLILVFSMVRVVRARREHNRKKGVPDREPRHPKQAIYTSLMRSARLLALRRGHNLGKSSVKRYAGGHIVGSAMCRGCGSLLLVDTTDEVASGTSLTEDCFIAGSDEDSADQEDDNEAS